MGPTGGYAFVVCPRTTTERPGRPSSWGSAEEAAQRAETTLARARERYGAWMSDAPPLLVGFSQGAEMAVVVAHASKLPIGALFVHEGGYRQQSVALGSGSSHPRARIDEARPKRRSVRRREAGEARHFGVRTMLPPTIA